MEYVPRFKLLTLLAQQKEQKPKELFCLYISYNMVIQLYIPHIKHIHIYFPNPHSIYADWENMQISTCTKRFFQCGFIMKKKNG